MLHIYEFMGDTEFLRYKLIRSTVYQSLSDSTRVQAIQYWGKRDKTSRSINCAHIYTSFTKFLFSKIPLYSFLNEILSWSVVNGLITKLIKGIALRLEFLIPQKWGKTWLYVYSFPAILNLISKLVSLIWFKVELNAFRITNF